MQPQIYSILVSWSPGPRVPSSPRLGVPYEAGAEVVQRDFLCSPSRGGQVACCGPNADPMLGLVYIADMNCEE